MGYDEEVPVDPSIYNLVYTAESPFDTLEDIFVKFNTSLPSDYTGRSLSVSDIVYSEGNERIDDGYYYCDSIGWRRVKFDETLCGKPEKSKLIRVIICEPGCECRSAYIEYSLESFQKIVGGDIEYFYPSEKPIAICCNEEGKINNMPINRIAFDDNGSVLDVICGPFFIAQLDSNFENLTSMDDEIFNEFAEKYKLVSDAELAALLRLHFGKI